MSILKKSIERIEHQINEVLDFVKEKPIIFEKCYIVEIIKVIRDFTCAK